MSRHISKNVLAIKKINIQLMLNIAKFCIKNYQMYNKTKF